VKVVDGFFLIGLSHVDADRARNIQLLTEHSWFDVPLVYANQRRATIAMRRARRENARSPRANPACRGSAFTRLSVAGQIDEHGEGDSQSLVLPFKRIFGARSL